MIRSTRRERGALVDALGVAARATPLTLAALVVLTVVAAVLPVAVAWCTKVLLDRVAAGTASWPELAGAVAGLLTAGLAGGVQPHLTQYLRAELDRRASLAAQDRLYAAVNRFHGLARFEDPAFLDRLRIAQFNGINAPAELTNTALGLTSTFVTLGGFFGSLLVISPVMAWIVLLGGVPTLLGEMRLARARVGITLDTSQAQRREMFFASLLADVQAAKEVRLFNLGDHFRRLMLRERLDINRLNRRMDRRTVLTQGGLALLAAGVAAGGLLWAVKAALDGRLGVGDIVVFLAAITAVQSSVGGLAAGVAFGRQHLLIFRHYRAVTAAGPDLPDGEPDTAMPPLRRGIELRNVWFRYSDEHPWVLRGVSLTIPYGQSLALVGVNGAGKSTLAKLLCRFYDPTRGAILWDGVDLRAVPVAALRERVSAVFQDFMTFDLTARENIALGDLANGADPAAIERAAERAGIGAQLAALPDGYETMLTRSFAGDSDSGGALGVPLSGGQWQRVALARALLRRGRDFILLDEPSSGLDPEAEYRMHEELLTHRSGGTSLLISHRLGMVRTADVIVVLEDGVVVEQGTHRDLLATGGVYARAFNRQASGYVAEIGSAR
ncbi:ABC transporter ATP-binding protein [Actinoplanes utahensis]|uniref:Multidrug ABC transporter permease n=1 Tax=Actinoplanes utahensis TaxID=1869 RepID=A0A0A6UKJ4_ACTUT|nr:ABC transporter ATP-binding protein [Actinoplanes utahensis]KHD75966.1 multidrug ABC transporter permease [Actinoplanes utahensis]GIF35075.1 multidrug ABC transporter permease [Actinoplanes utahensis]